MEARGGGGEAAAGDQAPAVGPGPLKEALSTYVESRPTRTRQHAPAASRIAGGGARPWTRLGRRCETRMTGLTQAL